MAFHWVTSNTSVHDHRDELVYLPPVLALVTVRHSPGQIWRLTVKLSLLAAHWNAHYRRKLAEFTNLDRLVGLGENESEAGHFDSTIPGCGGVGGTTQWRCHRLTSS